MYSLISTMPIAKGTFRYSTVESDIDKKDAINIAKTEVSEVIKKMHEMRMRHPRSFKNMPDYLLFMIMWLGNPRFGENRKIGEFRLWLASGEIEIIKVW